MILDRNKNYRVLKKVNSLEAANEQLAELKKEYPGEELIVGPKKWDEEIYPILLVEGK